MSDFELDPREVEEFIRPLPARASSLSTGWRRGVYIRVAMAIGNSGSEPARL
jgi:hypothetical protein